jgi:hypothetical protein
METLALETLGPLANDSPLHPDLTPDGGNASLLREQQDDDRPGHGIVGDAMATRPALQFAALRVTQLDSDWGPRRHAADLTRFSGSGPSSWSPTCRALYLVSLPAGDHNRHSKCEPCDSESDAVRVHRHDRTTIILQRVHTRLEVIILGL